MRSTLSTFTKHTMGRTSTKQRSITWWYAASPQMPGQGEHREQFRKIALQMAHHRSVVPQTTGAEAAKRGLGVGPAFGQEDRLRAGLHFVAVALPYFSPGCIVLACGAVSAAACFQQAIPNGLTMRPT